MVDYNKTNWENDITPVSAENMNKIENALQSLWPRVGDIEINISGINPTAKYPNTTWIQFGQGKTLVGVDTNDSNFNTVQKTGGESTHTLTTTEMPSHNHTQGSHRHAVTGNFSDGSGSSNAYTYSSNRKATTRYTDYQTPTINASGGGGAHNNLQPYITVYFWQRTA